MTEMAIKLSGVPRDRIDASLPPGQLSVTIRSWDGSQERMMHIPIMGASWNAALGDTAKTLTGVPVVFDPSNEFGKHGASLSAAGGVLLVSRGQCALCDKAVHAGAAGAVAVLVYEVEEDQAPRVMGAASMAPHTPPVPGFMIPLEGAQQLREMMIGGSEVRISGVEGGAANLFARLGEESFRNLAAHFYFRVYQDSDAPWFRDLFHDTEESKAADRLADFLIERMGGPALFSMQRGPIALIGRHLCFDIGAAHAEHWLEHMESAIHDTLSIDNDSANKLMDYFRFTAQFIAHSVEVAHGRGKVAA